MIAVGIRRRRRAAERSCPSFERAFRTGSGMPRWAGEAFTTIQKVNTSQVKDQFMDL
jgi:hypothetical protein